jgi:hypothetical protein
VKRPLVACAVAAMLNGCGGASLPNAPLGPPVASAPESLKSENLLYVIVAGFSDVYYYSYLPAPLKLVGKLTGLASPASLCVDKAGDIFISETNQVAEYAHGGTKRIATLKIPNSEPGGCSVDPATGDLAVVDSPKSGSDAILIYHNARGTPARYTDAHLQYPIDVGYDDKSNLFVDGYYYYFRTTSCCTVPAFAELPAKAKALKRFDLNAEIASPSTVQWDGKDLAIEDASSGYIDEFSISGNKGTEVGNTPLKGVPPSLYPVNAVWIAGRNVVGADASYAEVGVWHYPKGGKPFHTITGLYEPTAVTVSPGS